MAPVYRLSIDTTTLKVLIARSHMPMHHPDNVRAIGEGIRKWGLLVQARAVRNVSGYPVVYDGGTFRVQVRTGTLKGSIELQWPYQTAFAARVFVNGTNTAVVSQGGRSRSQSVAEYASAVEQGHKPIDLKQFMLGKVVPFFGAKSDKARGPYAARGLAPVDTSSTDYGSKWRSAQLDAKLAAKGKGPMTFTKRGGNAAYAGAKQGASTYFIAFRRVGKQGWIIPAAAPRPFMGAAVTGTADQGRLMLIKVVAGLFDTRG